MSAELFSTALNLAAAALLLVLAFSALRMSPKAAIVVWLFVICFIPIWIGQTITVYFPAFAIVGLLAAASFVPTTNRFRWSVADAVVLAVAVTVLAEYALKLTTRTATFDLFVIWSGAFLLGRVVTSVLDARWIYGAVAVFFSIAAVLALAEFVTGLNVFITYLGNGTALFDQWRTQQPRGGILRAEGAFGHSIALGSSLAIAATLTLGSRFRPWIKTAMLVVLLGGAVVTFSRTGMITAALGVVVACLFVRNPLSRRYRIGLLILAMVSAGVVFVSIRDVFLASGNEAEGSALYRSELLQLVGYIQPFGLAANFTVSTTSQTSIGEFGSVDNALLLFALTYGWVPTALLALLFAGAVAALFRGRATLAVVAVIAQLPALVTVALITQYAAVFWFAVGLAISTQVIANQTRAPRQGPMSVQHPRTADPAPPARRVLQGTRG
ncbi:hypothetical protein [uncultured Friedmanniella sp.]|uniref:hypothetical protein n=1 Tax=uncultured Friedmanniella sp. TaxID=335381 RepID=UPI0035C96F4B